MRSVLKNQEGDTIVEVLLSTAVIVAILGASYALSNRALQTGRAAQERTEALKIAETQIERLKAESSKQTFTSSYRVVPGNYCIDENLTKLDATVPANCGFGTNGRYKVNIAYSANDSGPDHYFGKFDVRVSWDRFGTGTPETMTINYQL